MGRSRRDVIDGDTEHWVVRRVLEDTPEHPAPPPHEDYKEVASVLLAWGDHTGSGRPVFWGTGLISFGPVTAAQTAFMAAIDATTDITDFPGDFVAVGWSPTTYEVIEFGIHGEFPFQYVKWGEELGSSVYVGEFSITDRGITLRGQADSAHYTGYRLDDAVFEATDTNFHSVLFWDLNIIDGTPDADLLQGGKRPETLRGLDGHDTLNGGRGDDKVEGANGRDLIEGGDGDDELYGGEGKDTLIAGDGSDKLVGGGDDDLLDPGAIVFGQFGLLDFNVDGGDGIDRVVLDYSDLRVLTPLLVGGTFVFPLPIINVEAVELIGGVSGDYLKGGGFADRLAGGAGHDVLLGGGGNDTLDGGPGGGAPSSLIVGGTDSRDAAWRLDHMYSLDAEPNIADATTIPHVTLELTIPGHDPDIIPGAVTAYYAFDAGAGDTVTIDVDVLLDADVNFSIEDAAGTVIANNGFLGAPDPGSTNADPHLVHQFAAAGTYYLRIEGLSLYENRPDAETFHTHVSLTSGNVLSGDRLDGGAGTDWADYSNSALKVLADLLNPAANLNDAAGDSYFSIENLHGSARNDTLRGNEVKNLIDGGENDDDLDGRGGDDVLRGSEGRDTLEGGAGADEFRLTDLGVGGADVIRDFASGEDAIVLLGSAFGLAAGALDPDNFAIGQPQDADDFLIYKPGNGKLYFDADGNGAGAAVHIATSKSLDPIAASDFIVV
ncbi:MAG: pre-peptidase C-terminal domain-containing protein [Sphingomonadaceae bacterium]|nr:pre-peptidase C-terminal domain-containing protein [Sphingomonadaceae bacterium]